MKCGSRFKQLFFFWPCLVAGCGSLQVNLGKFFNTQSLRYQINVRVLFSALCVLLLGSYIAIWQARNSVQREVDSSINLAVQLLSFSVSQMPLAHSANSDWLTKLAGIKATRHLSIQLQQANGSLIQIGDAKQPIAQADLPPAWFVNLVAGSYAKVEREIIGLDQQPLKVIIEANPLDEITEVWQESLGFLISLALLTSFTFLAVNLVFAKALRSIAVIVDALKQIETGNYQQKLPAFAIYEYDRIAKAINHMTAELHQSQQQNRALTLHSLQIQEDERQRLSQELHDELGQSLTAIKVMSVAACHCKANIQEVSKSIVAVCDHLIAVVRSMMHQLHPLILSELGLKAAMEDLAQHWMQRNPDLNIHLDCPEDIDGLGKHITIQIFRVVQECLTNVVRHAQAHSVSIRVAKEVDPSNVKRLMLAIEDDGQGFNPGNVRSGFGLLGMQERITSLNGTFSIQSTPDNGALICAQIPLT